jgi:hypothetical protein
VKGPATTLLHYTTSYQTTANGTAGTDVMTQRNDTAYDVMAATTATITANVPLVCTISGLLIPSANGTLIPRVRSEVTASNITVKRGSTGFLS